ncbi:MAG: hypothetical protein RI956_937 [Pseudomonadota bacterium]|jgi:hypothetical protein
MRFQLLNPKFWLQKHLIKYLINSLLLALLLGLITHTLLNILYGSPPVLAATSADDTINVAPLTPSTPAWLSTLSSSNTSVWNLVGTVVAGKGSYALLQKNQDRALLLRVGKQLADGTKLVSVKHKAATLLQNGTETTLTLAEVSSNNTVIDTGDNAANSSNSDLVNQQQAIEQQTAQQEQAAIQAQMEAAQIENMEKLKQEAESRQAIIKQQMQTATAVQAAQIMAIRAATGRSLGADTSLAPAIPAIQ